jgi:dTDP-glucose pyrophosphorylase
LRLISDITEAIVNEQALTLRGAMEAIDKSGLKAAIIVDDFGDFCGLLTDGDIRRALLRGLSLDDLAAPVINRNPICTPHASVSLAQPLAKEKEVDLIVHGSLGSKPKGIFVADSNLKNLTLPPVLIMAGGKGMRLRPLTENTPKPLIEVGGLPVIHRILSSLSLSGFSEVYISVNYLAEQIQTSIGDGRQFGLGVKYLTERVPMGTAGSIALLQGDVDFDSLIVMNADLILDLDFSALVQEHSLSGNDLTIVVRELVTNIPYGVIELDEGNVIGVKEKPTYSDLVSAGVYCIGPRIKTIVKDSPLDMPDLIRTAVDSGMVVGAFPIHLEWIDIGTHRELTRAKREMGDLD